MSYPPVPPNTGSSLATLSSASIRILWQKTVDTFEQSTDFFQDIEGAGSDACILTKTDTSKMNGARLTITNREGYYGEGKSGDATFENTTDFEEDIIGSYTLQVDWLRDATAITRRASEYMGMANELITGQAEELGKWMGRQKSDRMMMLFRERGTSANLTYAGGKLTEDELTSADGLQWNEIVTAKAQLMPMGGMPARFKVDGNGNTINRYLVKFTNVAGNTLKNDPDYQQNQREAGVRGDANAIYSGDWKDIDGNILKEFTPIDHAGPGPIGSAFNPKAVLGTAITAGTTTFDVKGGGTVANAAKTNKLYFKFFPNFAFEWIPDDILVAGTGVKYFIIVNPRGSGVGEDGKIGMYSYTTGNNGNKITIVERLGSAASGARVTTLGEVVWNTGVWAGKHTDAHPLGAIILACNAKGQPIGDTIILGAHAALRGYGSVRNLRTEQTQEGGFRIERYIQSVFGQKLRTDVSGRAPGFIRIRHALNYPGLGIPVIV